MFHTLNAIVKTPNYTIKSLLHNTTLYSWQLHTTADDRHLFNVLGFYIRTNDKSWRRSVLHPMESNQLPG